MKRSIRTCCVALALGAVIAGGCSKSSEKQSPASKQPGEKAAKSSPAPAKIQRPSSPALTKARKEPAAKPQPVALEKDYQAATEQNRKFEIIYKLGEDGSRDAVLALGRLFQSEPDVDLKSEIINVLSATDGSDKEKLAIYTQAAQPGQSNDVRLAAIDGLSDIEDLRVVPVLQGLTKDPDSEVSNAARIALEQVQSALAPQ